MAFKSVLFLFLHFIFQVLCDDQDATLAPPIIQTKLGAVQGNWQTTNNGKRFAAFQGIPYAKPPVGKLRFKAPEPFADRWEGNLNGSKIHTCVQTFLPDNKMLGFTGDEDCLYLSVFVPEGDFKPAKPRHVLVHIHGGAFMFGSGHHQVNPKVVMDRDWVLVHFNYRVGIMGFLSTEDSVLPGNYGLKDQVLALKWIRNNIGTFGGDPKSVTLTGHSAGGSSVHLHYLSPLSGGLFDRGMSQSGSALNPWAIKENPRRDALRLAALLNCTTDSSKEIKKCLRKKPYYDILLQVRPFYEYGRMVPFSPFAPTVDPHSKRPFLPKHPYELLKEGKVQDLPWIVSHVQDEGIFPIGFFAPKLNEVGEKWTEVAHAFLDYNNTLDISKRAEVATLIKDRYMGKEKNVSKETSKELIKMLSDRLFVSGVETAAKMQSSVVSSPVYYYVFNYANEKYQVARLFSQREMEGVCHGEDGMFFWGIMKLKMEGEEDLKMRSACLDMLHSYVTKGVPSFLENVEWKPVKDSKLTHLKIDSLKNVKMETVDEFSPVGFWNSVGFLENERYSESVKGIKDEL